MADHISWTECELFAIGYAMGISHDFGVPLETWFPMFRDLCPQPWHWAYRRNPDAVETRMYLVRIGGRYDATTGQYVGWCDDRAESIALDRIRAVVEAGEASVAQIEEDVQAYSRSKTNLPPLPREAQRIGQVFPSLDSLKQAQSGDSALDIRVGDWAWIATTNFELKCVQYGPNPAGGPNIWFTIDSYLPEDLEEGWSQFTVSTSPV